MLDARYKTTMKLREICAPDFDLAMTLDSGQVFHWQKIDDGFVGAIGDYAVYVEQHGDVLKVRMEGGSPATPGSRDVAPPVAELVKRYFALDHPLAAICASFPNDPAMSAARHFCRGLRIIRQPKWECLATFICSSMKQVAHIRQISKALRERFGVRRSIKLQRSFQKAQVGSVAPRTMLIYSASRAFVNIEQGTARSTNHTLYPFPAAGRIAASSESELRKCALGYRAKNLLQTARLVGSGEADLDAWPALSDADLREKLCALPGVGAKIANCVMLFAYERLRAFPIDVWIDRVLREKYFPRKEKATVQQLRDFSETYFGEHGGYAQQYLFHYARTALRKSLGLRDSLTPKVFVARNDNERERMRPSGSKNKIKSRTKSKRRSRSRPGASCQCP
jgi:N-glycosylase/DNA lyase